VRTVRALVQITRLDSAVLGWLSVFVPYLSRTRDAGSSAEYALPILFICMATFVANDLDDVARDAVNHPTRPLPGRQLPTAMATGIFFGCLGAALLTTKHLIQEDLAFWYYGLTIASVTYGYIVDSFAALKTAYVAACASIPIVIVSRAFPADSTLPLVAAAVFLATVGRETCMDIRDRRGDKPSIMHRMNATSLAIAALAMQLVALGVLAASVRTPLHVVALVAMTLTLGLASWCWFRVRWTLSIALMKVQFALGLAFLT
jgi:4-hydroxybenzoate polyprenyltransferase